MMEIAFVVCLSAEPLTCHTEAMQFSDMSMMACMVCAQPLIAQWADEHPGWQVQRWTCQSPRSERNA